jgi:hypothetical protein
MDLKMGDKKISKKDEIFSKICEICPTCRIARKKQKGLSYWIVKNVEDQRCPFCVSYEKVTGRKAHEPIP